MTGNAQGRGIGEHSDVDLIQEVATRAEVRVGRPGAAAGARKHTYAKRLLDRYQRRYGNRGLELESYMGRPLALQHQVKNAIHELGLETIPVADLR